MAKGGAMKGTKYMSLGGAAKSEMKANPGMGKKQIKSAVRRKRSKKQGVGGKPTNVKTFAASDRDWETKTRSWR